MPEPFLVAQLSDPHIGASWGTDDPAASLVAAIGSVRALDTRPKAVIVSGDLTDNGTRSELEEVKGLLDRLELPTYVLPGNHDKRAAMREVFGLPGAGGEPIGYAVDLGQMRIVVLDTIRPGSDGGELDGERLGWLDEELAEAPDTPTLIAMHHPPLVTGIPVMDGIGIPVADRQGLAEVLRRHPQVRRLVGGHIHRTIISEIAGRAVLAVPSTYLQAKLDFTSPEFTSVPEPPGFAVHLLSGGSITSHVQPVV